MLADALAKALRELFLPGGLGREEDLHAALRDARTFAVVQSTLEGPAEPALKLALLESLNKALAGEHAVEADPPSDAVFTAHVYRVLDYACRFALQLGPEQPEYLANSACNLFGQQVKGLVLGKHSARPALEALRGHLARADAPPAQLQLLLKFFHYCLVHVTMNPQAQSYFEHRRLVSAVEQLALPFFLEQTAAATKRLCGALAPGGAALAPLLLALEVLFRLLCYPFGLSYYDYTAELGGDEVGLVVYPESYAPLMEDRELVELLAQLFTAKLSREISLETLRIFNRMASCRLSLFGEEEERERHRAQFSRLFALLVQNAPLDDRSFQAELIEYGLRCLFVFGFRFVLQRAELQPQWELCWAELGLRVTRASAALADPVIGKYVEFLRKSIDNGCGQEPAARFVAGYCDHFFRHCAQDDFFPAEYLAARKFAKSVAKRFEGMRAVFRAARHEGLAAVAQAAEWLGRAEREAEPGVAATRLAHFLLAFTSWCVREDYRNDYFSEEAGGPEKGGVGGVCLRCFEMLGRAPGLCAALRPDLRRSLEMATLFFLEHFLTQVSKSLRWNEEAQRVDVLDALFLPLQAAGVCAGFEHFFDTFSDKVFSNLALGDATLSAYSIAVLRVAIERLKRSPAALHVPRLLAGVAERLFAAAGAFLGGPRELKLRCELMKLLPPIYLDNYLDDYIGNAQMLLARLEAADSAAGEVDVPRLLHDAIGLFAPVAHRKIFTAVCRIIYPRLQPRLQGAAAALMSSQASIAVLLDFYGVLLDQLLAYEAGMAQEVLVQVVTDSCSFVGLMAREVNSNLRAQPPAQLVAFVTDCKKLVKRLLGCFSKLLRYAGLSFLVLHAFGNQIFLDFVRDVLGFAALLAEAVLVHFPQLRGELVALLNELGPVVAQLAPALQPAEAAEYLRAVSLYFSVSLEQSLVAGDQRALADETVPSNTQAIVTAVFGELHDTQRICADKAPRVAELLGQTAAAAAELAAKALHYALLFHCSHNCTGMFADIVSTLLTAYHAQGLFAQLAQRFAALRPGEEGRVSFPQLAAAFTPSMLPRAREQFQAAFVQAVQEGRREQKRGDAFF